MNEKQCADVKQLVGIDGIQATASEQYCEGKEGEEEESDI